VEAAREYLDHPDRVREGTAERLPLADCSQPLIFCESVLEHVTSVTRSLDEMYRVLVPGGIAFITTTNRQRLSPTGKNDEYRVRCLQWLPDVVKECFVFHHLHYDPRLANHAMLPAVHWFSYADLCKLGRRSGFAHFYSMLDLLRAEDPSVQRGWIKRRLLNRVQRNPWLRAAALTQVGETILMLKPGSMNEPPVEPA
jgi:SAM-dependent methyltransferase